MGLVYALGVVALFFSFIFCLDKSDEAINATSCFFLFVLGMASFVAAVGLACGSMTRCTACDKFFAFWGSQTYCTYCGRSDDDTNDVKKCPDCQVSVDGIYCPACGKKVD